MFFGREGGLRFPDSGERKFTGQQRLYLAAFNIADQAIEKTLGQHGGPLEFQILEVSLAEIKRHDRAGDGPRCDIATSPFQCVNKEWKSFATHHIGHGIHATLRQRLL